MSPRLFQILQAISLAALAWFGYGILHRVHPLLAFVPVLIAALNVVVVWLLRYAPDRLTPFFLHPYVGRYLKWVCHLAGEQPAHPVDAPSTEFLLHSDADFRAANWRAK